MSFRRTTIKFIAWLNFGLALAGIAKFVPIGYLLVLSIWAPIDPVACEWSLDLISATHLIVSVWCVALIVIKAMSGRIIVRPWRAVTLSE
jgi:hypothetical protein